MKPTTTYIYHVTGTLEWKHIEASLESLRKQKFHWEKFVLFNHSAFDDVKIMGLVDLSKFDHVRTYNVPQLPPTVAADWFEQMKGISGTDRYLCHKADFYLYDYACEYIDNLKADEWFICFKKIDMKERATIEDFREFASRDWYTNIHHPMSGRYPSDHLGKLAVPCIDVIDGIMHAYTDSIREHYQPSEVELNRRWGFADSIRELQHKVPFVVDDKFYALHMWHNTPDRNDPIKNMPGERF